MTLRNVYDALIKIVWNVLMMTTPNANCAHMATSWKMVNVKPVIMLNFVCNVGIIIAENVFSASTYLTKMEMLYADHAWIIVIIASRFKVALVVLIQLFISIINVNHVKVHVKLV